MVRGGPVVLQDFVHWLMDDAKCVNVDTTLLKDCLLCPCICLKGFLVFFIKAFKHVNGPSNYID